MLYSFRLTLWSRSTTRLHVQLIADMFAWCLHVKPDPWPKAAHDISITSWCSNLDIQRTCVWQAISCLLAHSTCRQTGKHGGSCRGCVLGSWMQMRFFPLIFLQPASLSEKKNIFLWEVFMSRVHKLFVGWLDDTGALRGKTRPEISGNFKTHLDLFSWWESGE